MALKQQFIIDYMVENDYAIPNSFCQDDVVDRINMKGFEIWDSFNFREAIGLTNSRYKGRIVVPFAGRKANDDVAAFLIYPPERGQVVVYHGFTDPGYDRPIYYQTFTDWLEGESDIAEL